MRWRSGFAAAVGILFLAFLSHPAAPRPREASRSIPPSQLGQVTFPTSCTADAQSTIVNGVALLHSFQYMEASGTFSDAVKQDPQCAMAHWGKAMSLYHQLWDFPQPKTLNEGREEIQQAQKLTAATDRERAYIAAAAAFYQDNPKLSHAERTQAYSASLAKLHAQSPQDPEASEFYALSLIALAAVEQIDEMSNRRAAIAILEPILQQQPDSPGAAHYLIHATDVPELAPQGLTAARRYAKIAPDSSHAIHMPSHIFARLGLWQESIASNLAAVSAATHEAEMHHSEAHYQTHAMDYLDYAYLQTGQESKARQVAAAELNVVGSDDEEKANHQTIVLARNALELHHWKEAAALPIPAIREVWLDTAYYTRAIGAARSGDLSAAREAIEKLKKCVVEREAHQRKEGYPVSAEKATDLAEAESWLAFAQGKTEEALTEMRAATARQEKERLENAGMPAREMLADMLLEAERPADALAEYKIDLTNSPNRFDALLGAAHAAQALGNSDAAREYYSKLAEISAPGADRAELAEAKIYLAKK